MRHRLPFLLLLGVAVVFGFVNVQDTNPPSIENAPSPSTVSPTGRLELAAGELTLGADASFIVTYENASPVTLTFGSGQDADVALLSGDQVVWRWSDGRSFAQVVRQVGFEPGRHGFTLAGSLEGVPRGSYTAVATLAATPAPPPARLTVRVG